MPNTQRAILQGSIAAVVQIRNMFTGSVVLNEQDTYLEAWSEYLNAMFEDIKAHLTSSVTYYNIVVQDWDGTAWQPRDELAINWTGSGSGDFLPNAVAVVMIAKAFGKRLVGRKFWSGLVEGSSNDNHLNGAAVTAFAQCVVDYVAQFTSTGGTVITPGIVGKDLAFHSFLSGTLSTLLGSMRRRKPGVGI